MVRGWVETMYPDRLSTMGKSPCDPNYPNYTLVPTDRQRWRFFLVDKKLSSCRLHTTMYAGSPGEGGIPRKGREGYLKRGHQVALIRQLSNNVGVVTVGTLLTDNRLIVERHGKGIKSV